jgi:NosR/NirI family transcriptional regulator, nitrous oxide reductase regulator
MFSTSLRPSSALCFPVILRRLLFLILMSILPSTLTLAQSASIKTPWTTQIQPEWLNQVMPEATSFSEKEGEPPVYRAYRQNAEGEAELVGFVFLSEDIPPEEVGYSAPIAMLIGLNVQGNLSGIKILTYYESFAYSRGDFVADPKFQAQFPGKAITDEFRLKRDIDGLSSATMTSFAISRGARNAARRVAAAYLDFQEGDAEERAWAANARRQLEQLTWEQMLDQGMVRQLTMPVLTGGELELTIAYIGHPVLGEFFIGPDDYTRAERDSSIRLGGREMVLVAIGGSGSRLYRQHLLMLQQGDGPARPVQLRRFVTAGNADEGAIAGRADYAGAIVLEENIDVTQPFTISYQPQGSETPYSVEYQLGGLGLALARNEPILSEEEIARALLAEAGFITRLRHDPPWGDTPWLKVSMLLLVFALVMTSFLRKSSTLRWVTLSVTLFYLGFFDGGFLSVSHITGALTQGPQIFLNNLPMLMLVTFTLITTLLWGRVFCSSLCPFGALQDFITRFFPRQLLPRNWRQLKLPQWLHDRALFIKYALLALILGTALTQTNVSIFQYFEPFGTLFYFSPSVLLWSILIAIVLGCVLIERFYCRYLCPLGAALGVVSMLSPWRIKRVPQCSLCKVCEHACPTGAIRGPAIDFKECVRCDICESKLINRAGTCRHSMDEITRRQQRREIPVIQVPG